MARQELPPSPRAHPWHAQKPGHLLTRDWPESCLERSPKETILQTVPVAASVNLSTALDAPAEVKPAKSAQHLGFGDLLATINPLQHIPVIGSIYRAVTGDTMSPTAEVVGGALFGGLIGAVTSLADVVFAQATGRNVGDTVLAWLGFDGGSAKTRLAKASPSSESTTDTALVTQAAFAYERANTLQTESVTPGLSLLY